MYHLRNQTDWWTIVGQITNTGQGAAMERASELADTKLLLKEYRAMLAVAEQYIEYERKPKYLVKKKAAYMAIRAQAREEAALSRKPR